MLPILVYYNDSYSDSYFLFHLRNQNELAQLKIELDECNDHRQQVISGEAALTCYREAYFDQLNLADDGGLSCIDLSPTAILDSDEQELRHEYSAGQLDSNTYNYATFVRMLLLPDSGYHFNYTLPPTIRAIINREEPILIEMLNFYLARFGPNFQFHNVYPENPNSQLVRAAFLDNNLQLTKALSAGAKDESALKLAMAGQNYHTVATLLSRLHQGAVDISLLAYAIDCNDPKLVKMLLDHGVGDGKIGPLEMIEGSPYVSERRRQVMKLIGQ